MFCVKIKYGLGAVDVFRVIQQAHRDGHSILIHTDNDQSMSK